MAGYSGYFMSGMASGLESGINMGTKLAQLRWQKKKQKEIDDLNIKMSDVWGSISQEIITLADKGYLSEDDNLRIYTLTLAAPLQMQGEMGKIRASLSQFQTNDFEEQMEYIKTFLDWAEGQDYKDISSVYESMRPHITDPQALALYEVGDKKLRHETGAAEEKRILDISGKLPEPYKYPYLKEEGVVGEITPTEKAPKEPSAADRKLDMVVDQYSKDLISFEQLSKYLGTYITPEKATGLEKQIQDIKIQGKAAGLPQEEISTAIKNKILGTGGGDGTITPTPTSVESVRDSIKDAPTIEDARRIEKNHIAKYGDTTGIPDVDKFWSDERVKRLDSLKKGIDKLLDEKKQLKKGTVTSAEVGFEIEDDVQKVEAVYQQLREEYMKYREMLKKMGIDISQFPELMSYDEYIKSDIKPGMGIFYPSTWGKQKPPVY